MSSQQEVTHSGSDSRLTGRVKWFNNKRGLGYITITDGAKSGSDIFVHHTAISVANQQFKYLVQGEYVELSEVAAVSGPYESQASNVIGVNGGKLMCETRNELKIARSNYKNTQKVENVPVESSVEQSVEVKKTPKPKAEPKSKKTRNNESNDSGDKNEWTQVTNKSDKPKRAPRKPKVVDTN